MFNWFSKKRDISFETEIKKSFSDVKNDMKSVGKWIEHLDKQDKQLFNSLNTRLSTVENELSYLRAEISEMLESAENKQLFNFSAKNHKQPAVQAVQNEILSVQEPVQTAVQSDNVYDILKELSSNERLIIFTLLNSEMKLSYEDIALLLGKEKPTIRGQINAIRQKARGVLEEMTEKNGKKRVYIPAEIKEKLQKYAKVRLGKDSKGGKRSR